jgi:hypothetical protein
MAKPAQPGWVLAARAIKGAGIALGGVCTFVAFASLVGVVTGNAWARAIVALGLTVIFPAAAVDRALPKAGGRARAGLVGDIVALVLLGIALLFVGVGEPFTRPLLVREGDRLAEDGHDVPAHVVYFLAGVRPVDGPVPAPTAGPTSSPTGSPGAPTAASPGAAVSAAPSGGP